MNSLLTAQAVCQSIKLKMCVEIEISNCLLFLNEANYTTGQLIHDKVAGPSMSQIVHYQKSRPSAFSSKLHDLDENSQETG